MERLPGRDNRLTGLAEVRHVVQRIVEAKDVDAVRGGARDEPPDDVRADRLRADEETAAQCDAERRLRPRIDRADPLPGTLHGALDRRVEHATARDLQAGKA